MMSGRCSYSLRRAKIRNCCRSRVRANSSRKAPDSARRCCSLSQWKSSTSHANCWCSKRVLPRPYIARNEAKSGAATLNCSPRWRHGTAGTMRTASRTRPLIRKKPICNANPSFRAGRRRCSITCRSVAVNVKNASISKAVSSRRICFKPKNVACYGFIARSWAGGQ